MDGTGFTHEFPRRDRRKSKWWLILGLFWVFALISLALSSPSSGTELPRAISEYPPGH
jgi:hypothetical protein